MKQDLSFKQKIIGFYNNIYAIIASIYLPGRSHYCSLWDSYLGETEDCICLPVENIETQVL